MPGESRKKLAEITEKLVPVPPKTKPGKGEEKGCSGRAGERIVPLFRKQKGVIDTLIAHVEARSFDVDQGTRFVNGFSAFSSETERTFYSSVKLEF